jgi:hypothetical protein
MKHIISLVIASVAFVCNSIALAQSTTGKDTIVIFGLRFAVGAKAQMNNTDIPTIRINSRTLKAVVPAGYIQGKYKITVVNPAPQRGGAVSEKELTIIQQDYIAVEYHYTTQELSYQQPQNQGVLSSLDSMWVFGRAAPVEKSQQYDGFIFVDGTSTVTIEELQDPTLTYIADNDIPSSDDMSMSKTSKISSRYVQGQRVLEATAEIMNSDGTRETQNIKVPSYKSLVDSLKTSPITANPMLVSQQARLLKENAVADGLPVRALGNERWHIDIPASKFPVEIPNINFSSGMTAAIVVNVAQNFIEAIELLQNNQPVSRTFFRKANGRDTMLFPYDAIYTESYYTARNNLAMKAITSTQYSNTNFIVKVKAAPPVTR